MQHKMCNLWRQLNITTFKMNVSLLPISRGGHKFIFDRVQNWCMRKLLIGKKCCNIKRGASKECIDKNQYFKKLS